MIRLQTSILILLFLLSAAVADAAQVFTVVPEKSAVRFRVSQTGIPLVNGRFEKFSGTLTFDQDHFQALEGVVEMDSLKTGLAARDKDLKADHFFAVRRFPQMIIKSLEASESADKLKVKADVTIRDITKPLELYGTLSRREDGVILSLDGFALRKDYHLKINRVLDFFVNDKVKISLKLFAVPEEHQNKEPLND